MDSEFIGAGSIVELGKIFDKISPKKVFIVSGKKSYDLSGARQGLETQLAGIDHYRHSDFSENPKFEDLISGATLVRNYVPDLIIAIGGGSVIDTAKIISVLPSDIHLAKKVIKGDVSVNNKIAPIVAIPTTSGSGSEATHFAVAYLENAKYSVASNLLLPDYVILDPELTYSMPANQTAVSGIDALSQGIESFWARGANEQSRAFASKAIEIILNSLEKAVNSPDPKARLDMAVGSNFAGKAINISKTTAPHAISYALTTFYGVPHGHAVALTIGEFMVLNTANNSASSRESLTDSMQSLIELMGCNNAEDCRERFYQIMKNIGLETRLSEIITEVDLQLILENINTERLGNHPISLSNDDIQSIIRAIL